jgi:hypothetical protein
MLFDFFTEYLADWRHPLAYIIGRAHTPLSVCKHAQKSKSTSNSALTLAPGAPMHLCAFAAVHSTRLI